MMCDVYWVRGAVKGAVNSVFNDDVGVTRLNVDIGSAPLEGIEHNRVHQLDDGGHLLVARQAVHVQVFFTVLGLDQQRELVGSKPRGSILEDSSSRITALEDFFDCRPCGDCYLNPHADLSLDL